MIIIIFDKKLFCSILGFTQIIRSMIIDQQLISIHNANSVWYLKPFDRLKTTQLNISGFIFHCKRFNDLRRKSDLCLSLNYDNKQRQRIPIVVLGAQCSVFMQPNEMKSPMQLIRPNEIQKLLSCTANAQTKKKPVFA